MKSGASRWRRLKHQEEGGGDKASANQQQ